MMKRFINHVRSFIADESGTAIIEWVIVLCIVAGLAAIIMTVGRSAGNKVQDVGRQIDELDVDFSLE